MNEMRKTVLAEQKKKKECFKSFFNFLVMNVLGVRKKFFFVVFFIVVFLICGVPTILYVTACSRRQDLRRLGYILTFLLAVSA